MGMTLNTDLETILDLNAFVEQHHLFEEEFYKNLYVIIEKEKYLVSTLRAKPFIYPSLSDKTRNIIERMFIDKLSNYSEEEANSITEELVRNGYFNVLDRDYLDYFKGCEFDNKPSFDIIESNYVIIKAYNINSTVDIDVILSKRGDLQINYSRMHLRDTRYSFKDVEFSGGINSHYIFVRELSKKRRFAIDIKTHKLLRVPNSYGWDTTNIFDDVVCVYRSGGYAPIEKIMVCNKSKQIYELDNADDYCEDIVNKLLLVSYRNRNAVDVFDSNYNLVKTIDFSHLSDRLILYSAHDGIMLFRVGNVCTYYDYINMKEIDCFTSNGRHNYSLFGYSEGLYNYVDSNTGLVGYKDLNHNIVIKPKFTDAGMFYDNSAYVEIGDNRGVSDRVGNFVPRDVIEKEVIQRRLEYYKKHYNQKSYRLCYERDMFLKSNPLCGKNVFLNTLYHIAGYLTKIDNYLVRDNTPIMDIDFDKEKEKAM